MAGGTAISSGLLAAGTFQIATGKNMISAVSAISDSTNVATITIYDNAAGDNSGTVLAQVSATVNTGSNSVALLSPVRADYGIVAIVSGVGAPRGLVYYGA